MTLEEIQKEAGRFFSWPTDNKETVTTTSACLFAAYILTRSQEKAALNITSELSELIDELPQSLRSLPWKIPTPQDVWDDGSVLLVAIPIVGLYGKTWWELAVATVVCDDDYFRLEVDGEEWGWNYAAIDLVVQIY